MLKEILDMIDEIVKRYLMVLYWSLVVLKWFAGDTFLRHGYSQM